MIMVTMINSSVIKQKDESQNGVKKKTKHPKFSEKTNFLYPPNTHMCAYREVRNFRFSENLAFFVSLLPPF